MYLYPHYLVVKTRLEQGLQGLREDGAVCGEGIPVGPRVALHQAGAGAGRNDGAEVGRGEAELQLGGVLACPAPCQLPNLGKIWRLV